MMVIVRNVTAGCEEPKIVAAGKAIEVDLKDLLECVWFHIQASVQWLTDGSTFQYSENNRFRSHQDSESESVAHNHLLKSQ